MKNFLILICALFSISCTADEIKCKYKKSFVEESVPSSKEITKTNWSHHTDSDSGEYVDELYIQYSSNNKATAKHKYCDIYNFEFIYKKTDGGLMSESDIARRLVEAFTMSKIRPHFKKKLHQIVLEELSSSGFDANKNISIGLSPDHIDFDQNVEYGIEYTVIANKSAELIFYMSIGGM